MHSNELSQQAKIDFGINVSKPSVLSFLRCVKMTSAHVKLSTVSKDNRKKGKPVNLDDDSYTGSPGRTV